MPQGRAIGPRGAGNPGYVSLLGPLSPTIVKTYGSRSTGGSGAGLQTPFYGHGAAPVSSMKAKLVVVSGNSTKREVKLRLPVIVGRNRDAGLSIAHPTVSRRHCELFERDGVLMVSDFGSLNGTLVGNLKVTEAVIRPGDQLTIGPLTFMAIYDPPKAMVPKRKGDSSWSKIKPSDLAAPASQVQPDTAPAGDPSLSPLVIEDDEISRVDVSHTAASAWVPSPVVPAQQFEPELYDSGDWLETIAPPPPDLNLAESSTETPPVNATERAVFPSELNQTSSWTPPPNWQTQLEGAAPAVPGEAPAETADVVSPEASPSLDLPPALPTERPPPSYDFQDAISEELELLFDDGAPATRPAAAELAAPLPAAEPIPVAADDLDGFLEVLEPQSLDESGVPIAAQPVDLDDFLADELSAAEQAAAFAPEAAAQHSIVEAEFSASLELEDLTELAPEDVAPVALAPAAQHPPVGVAVDGPLLPEAELELASDEIEVSPDQWPTADAAATLGDEALGDDVLGLLEIAEGPLPTLASASNAATGEMELGFEELIAGIDAAGDDLLLPESALTAAAFDQSALTEPAEPQPVTETPMDFGDAASADIAPEVLEDLLEESSVSIPESAVALTETVEAIEPSIGTPEVSVNTTAPEIPVGHIADEDPSREVMLSNLLDDEPSEVEPADLPDFDEITPMSEVTPAEGTLDAALLAPADEFLPGALHPELADVTPPELHKIDAELDSSVLPVFDAGESDPALRSGASADPHLPRETLPHAQPVAAEPDLDDALFAFDSLDDAPARRPAPVETLSAKVGEWAGPEPIPVVPPASPASISADAGDVDLWQSPSMDASSDLATPSATAEAKADDIVAWLADDEPPAPLIEERADAAAGPLAVSEVDGRNASVAELDELASDVLFAEEPPADVVTATSPMDNFAPDPVPELAADSREQPQAPESPIEYDSWEDVPMPVPPRSAETAAAETSAALPPTAPPPVAPESQRPKARKWTPPAAPPEASSEANQAGRSWWPFGKGKAKNQAAAALQMAADIRQEKMSHGQSLAPPPPVKRGLLGFLRRKPAIADAEVFPPPAQHPAGPWSNTPPQVAAPPVVATETKRASAPKPLAAASAEPAAAPRQPIPPVVATKTVPSPPPHAEAPAAPKKVLSNDELDEFLRDLG